jgi:DNA-binding transcriptional LysR family regulator
MAQLADLDLNLLRVFAQLHEQRRVSRVAETLGLSQPAVSNALARLRKALGDPLFVATPAGMAPTPLAEELAGPVAQALATLHAALSRPQGFEPTLSQRVFTVGMTDIGEIYFLPALMGALAERAPNLALSTVRNTSVNLKEAMEGGQVDLAIGLLPQLSSGFHRRTLFTQRYVCMMRADHPLAQGGAFGLEQFSAANHLGVVTPGNGHGRVDELLARSGIQRRVRLTVPHFVAIGHILASTDLIATVPERLAQRLASVYGLVALPHPADLPEVSIAVYWHAKLHGDAGNLWLRQLVGELFVDSATAAVGIDDDELMGAANSSDFAAPDTLTAQPSTMR